MYQNKVYPVITRKNYNSEKQKKAEEKLCQKCKVCFCLSFSFFIFVYMSIIFIILINKQLYGDYNYDEDLISYDSSSSSENQKRILTIIIECSEEEFGCCEGSLIMKKDKAGSNCVFYLHEIDKIVLYIIFITLCICGFLREVN
tara:strand:- start:1353 stop:1784 length:432 start_codon:yes stop_codon:yes gene_type:complete